MARCVPGIKIAVAAWALAAIYGFSAHAGERLDSQDNIVLGIGYDSLRGKVKSAVCIRFAKGTASGQIVEHRFRQVNDKETLSRALDLSVSAKISGIMGSADARYRYVESVETSSEMLNIAARTIVTNGAEFVAPTEQTVVLSGESGKDPVRSGTPASLEAVISTPATSGSIALTEAAAELLKKEGVLAFRQRCGDSFVSVIYGGAELNGQLTFHTTSREEMKQISASVTGSFLGASGSASRDETIKRFSEQKKLSITYYQMGGAGTPVALTSDEFLGLVRNLANTAKIAPRNSAMVVSSYRELADWHEKVPIASYEQTESLLRSYYRLNDALKQLSNALAEPNSYVRFGGISTDMFKSKYDDSLSRLRKMEATISCLYKLQLPADCPKNTRPWDSTDYEILAFLPIRKSSFDSDSRLSELLVESEKLNASVEAAAEKLRRFQNAPFCLNDAKSASDSLRKTVARRKIIDSQLGELFKTRATDVVDAMMLQNVIRKSDQLCIEDSADNGCLTQVERDRVRRELASLATAPSDSDQLPSLIAAQATLFRNPCP
jgi:hypothetical protein